MKRLVGWVRRLSFNSRLLAATRRRTHILFLGDSHVGVFEYVEARRLMPWASIRVCEVGGATAQGLVNPNSKTDAMGIFRRRLEAARPFQTIVFQLGEVDGGFVIWCRAKKHGLSVESQLEHSVACYMRFLDETYAAGFKNIVVLSAPLPTIADHQDWGDVASARREVDATRVERTELTLKYNDLLRIECNARNCLYLDVTFSQIDDRTGTIRSTFLNADPLDHHLDNAEYAALVVPELESLLRPGVMT